MKNCKPEKQQFSGGSGRHRIQSRTAPNPAPAVRKPTLNTHLPLQLEGEGKAEGLVEEDLSGMSLVQAWGVE